MRNSIVEFIGKRNYDWVIFKAEVLGLICYVLWMCMISYLSSNVPQLSKSQIVLLGMIFIFSNQLGRIVSEYLFTKFEQALVLRRIMIISILSQIIIVSTSNYSTLVISIFFLGISTGADLSYFYYLYNSPLALLFIGLAWSLSSSLFHVADIIVMHKLRLSRKFLMLGNLMICAIVSLVKSEVLDSFVKNTQDSMVRISRQNSNIESQDIIVPLVVIHENEESEDSFIVESYSSIFIKAIAFMCGNICMIYFLFLVPTLRFELIEVIISSVSGLLGVIAAIYIKKKKISAIAAFVTFGIWQIACWYFVLGNFIIPFGNIFLFVGFVNLASFISSNFYESRKLDSFKITLNIADFTIMIVPLVVHLVYMDISQEHNMLVFGVFCCFTGTLIGFIKE